MKPTAGSAARTKPCRDCRREVSEDAYACPHCGAPYPARVVYRNRRPVVARGVVAIGQFACGLVCISQFGIGLVSVSQFTLAGYALAQFAAAYSLIAQFGLYVAQGRGQFVMRGSELLERLGVFWQ